MPWAVSCCPFGASLGANLLNAALLFTRPKAFTRSSAALHAEGFTRTAGALPVRRTLPAALLLYPAEGLYTRLRRFTRTAGALHGGSAALLIQLPRRPVLGVLYLKAQSCQLITNLVAGGPVLIGLCLGTQVEHHVYHLSEGLLTGGVTAS